MKEGLWEGEEGALELGQVLFPGEVEGRLEQGGVELGRVW